jgi:hypothetical protein
MVLLPIFAVAGLKFEPETPVPDQTPPAEAATNATADSFEQNGPSAVIVASTSASTWKVSVSESEQALLCLQNKKLYDYQDQQ